MKVLVTGSEGQLGSEIINQLKLNNIEFFAATHKNMDITNFNQVQNVFNVVKPDVVIHCAAYTLVDKAENEKDKCYLINVTGTKNIVNACENYNSKLIFFSSDYVFDGTKDFPYEVFDKVMPLNFYGLTKAEAEKIVKGYIKHFIIRISWVFGENGKNFVSTMVKLLNEKEEINVVSDQIGSPSYTCDIASLVLKIMQTEKYGVYHATNEGKCSWYEFACYIKKCIKSECKINKILSKDYKTNAIRPKNSILSKKSLLENNFELLPEWQNAVKKYLEKIKAIN